MSRDDLWTAHWRFAGVEESQNATAGAVEDKCQQAQGIASRPDVCPAVFVILAS